jgi:hypothetical protein
VTAAGQQPETEPVDLAVFSTRFQSEIDAWQGSADATATPDSSAVPDSSAMPDSTTGSIVGLSDSSVASVEAVSDTLEDCAGED